MGKNAGLYHLETIPLFRGLSDGELKRIARYLHRKTFFAGTTIITADEPGEAAYVILDGTIKIHVEQPDGRDVILAILGSGQVVGEMSLADSQASSATVVTLDDSDLLFMERTHFQECLHSMPIMTYNLVLILTRRLRLANTQLQSRATLDLRSRIARQLLAFSEEYGRTDADGSVFIPIRLTQSDLADLVGASRVRINKVLVDYKQRGFISVDQDHHFTLHDRTLLVRIAIESTKTPDRDKRRT